MTHANESGRDENPNQSGRDLKSHSDFVCFY